MAPIVGMAAVALFAWMVQSPAPVARVVLLPGPDGKVGRVVVNSQGHESTLESAYAGTEIGASGKMALRQESEASVRERYGAALDARPMRPVSYRVYFVSGRDALTPESLPVLQELKTELGRRPAPEMTVVGHTDRVGSVEANDRLSLQRAETMRKLLIEQGVSASAIEVAGRGEREPLIPTADEVAEARNRRVEIGVR